MFVQDCTGSQVSLSSRSGGSLRGYQTCCHSLKLAGLLGAGLAKQAWLKLWPEPERQACGLSLLRQTLATPPLALATRFPDVKSPHFNSQQGSYIASSTKNIEEIYQAIHSSERLVDPEDLRIGLIAFRDHPPQDHTYVTRNFGFSSDPSKVAEQLKGLYASGGGDGPEAVTAALGEALDMDWRPTASKMVVLIADAPPHGIGEYGDGQSQSL